MTQEKLNEVWSLIAVNAVVWGWTGKRHGDLQTLIHDNRLLWSRRAPEGAPPGSWAEIPLSAATLSRVAT